MSKGFSERIDKIEQNQFSLEYRKNHVFIHEQNTGIVILSTVLSMATNDIGALGMVGICVTGTN